MNPAAPQSAGATPWWQRARAALMPDYNRKAAIYWFTIVAMGASAFAWAVWSIAGLPGNTLVQVLVGCAIAMLAGMYPVRIPGSKNSFAAGEIFIFLLLLMHGPAAATLAATGEVLVGALRTSKRLTSRLASPAIAALAMSLTGGALHASLDWLRSFGLYNAAMLLLCAMAFAVAYFLISTALITAIPYLKRNQQPKLRELFGSFGWVGLTYASSSLIAGLLELSFENVGIGVLAAAIPIIAMLLSMLHYHFRQREVDSAAQLLRVEVAEREAEQSARHVQELRLSEQRFHSAFSNAAIGMALVSTDGRVLQVNSALGRLLGRPEEGIIGRLFEEFVEARDLMHQLLPAGPAADPATIELRCRHLCGDEVWVSMHAGFFSEPHSNAPCLILQAQDVTARRRAESRLQHIAYHDGLTTLCNRARFTEHVAAEIGRHAADPRHRFAVMYLDFDRFKLINDTLGHSAGDEFLVAAARRIQQHVRPGDVVGRLGGDEFAILVRDLESEPFAVTLAERLQEALCKPYSVGGTEINSSASIGITFASSGYATPDEVLRDADIAMYRAKSEGRARYWLFDAELRAKLADQVQLEADLRGAIERDELSLDYQPIYELATGRIVSFEALARWHHPQRGTIPPDRFIAIAEESGLIGALTERMLSRACAQLKAWHGLDSRHRQLGMQVNLSSIDLRQGGLALKVATTLLTQGLAASHLTLEITESKLMTRLADSIGTITRLRDIGAGISVDDFGTGYSSLSYLSTLPITSLKIDRSFVERLSAGTPDAEVVKAIVTLGNALGKSVVAEGIETADQLAKLRALGCHFGQGYLLSRPLSADKALGLLEQSVASRPKIPARRATPKTSAARLH